MSAPAYEKTTMFTALRGEIGTMSKEDLRRHFLDAIDSYQTVCGEKRRLETQVEDYEKESRTFRELRLKLESDRKDLILKNKNLRRRLTKRRKL